jgi:peptidoglycan/xylan/chitin deacetylase (PgdA/CDA1 family)
LCRRPVAGVARALGLGYSLSPMANSKAAAPAAPRWPGETRAACAFTFDMDAETLWMARDIHEPVTLSQGRFGPVEALPRILALLEKAEVRASFFIPAWVASHYADAVRAIAVAGHEIGCHGDEHERVSGLEPTQEEAILTKSLETLTPLAGRRPVGWRAPAWQLSAKSLDLVAKHGFEYSSNMMDRLVPYLHPEPHGVTNFAVESHHWARLMTSTRPAFGSTRTRSPVRIASIGSGVSWSMRAMPARTAPWTMTGLAQVKSMATGASLREQRSNSAHEVAKPPLAIGQTRTLPAMSAP